jgi:hypothetical protein
MDMQGKGELSLLIGESLLQYLPGFAVTDNDFLSRSATFQGTNAHPELSRAP